MIFRRAHVSALLALIILSLCACVRSSSVQCGDVVCPEGTVCGPIQALCVFPDQLTSCVGVPDQTECMIAGNPGGICSQDICVTKGCGDGFVIGAENCDGDNLAGKSSCGDLGFYSEAQISCRADCVYDTSSCAGAGHCGDHIIDTDAGEFCDAPELPINATNCIDFGYDVGRVSCTDACAPGFGGCERWGFAPVFSGTAETFISIWGSGPNDVYAVGLNGMIRHWDGATWSASASGTTERLNSVWGTGPNDVWAVGSNGTILHKNAAGWTLSPVPSAIQGAELNAVWGSAPDNVLAVGNAGATVRWNGSVWSVETASPFHLISIWGSGPDNIYVVGSNATIVRYNGTSWAPVATGLTQQQLPPNSPLYDIWGTGPDDIWIVGSDAVLRRTSAGWSTVPAINNNAYSVWGTSERVYFAGATSVIVRDRSAYVKIATVLYSELWGTDDEVWAAGLYGAIHRFTGAAHVDDGAPLTSNKLLDAWGTSANNVYVVGETGTVLHWNGSAWTGGAVLPATVYAAGVWMAAPNDVFIVGPSGSIFRGSGASFAQMTSNTTSAFLVDVWGTSATNVYAVGGGEVYRWNGLTWQATTVAAGAGLQAIWGTSASDIWVAGYDSAVGTLVMHFNGTTWTRVDAGMTAFVRTLWGSATDNVYAGGDGGLIRWDGIEWKRVDTGVLEPIQEIAGSGPNDVFVTTIYGGLVHFDGTVWSRARSNTTSWLHAAWVGDGRAVFAGDAGTTVVLLRP